jgi:hypothetical protein
MKIASLVQMFMARDTLYEPDVLIVFPSKERSIQQVGKTRILLLQGNTNERYMGWQKESCTQTFLSINFLLPLLLCAPFSCNP